MDSEVVESETKTGQYTWMLFGDLTGGNTGVRVWQTGPDRGAIRASYQELVSRGKPFEMRDSEGQLVYTGYIVGDFRGEEPLNDFGSKYGCCQISYPD